MVTLTVIIILAISFNIDKFVCRHDYKIVYNKYRPSKQETYTTYVCQHCLKQKTITVKDI